MNTTASLFALNFASVGTIIAEALGSSAQKTVQPKPTIQQHDLRIGQLVTAYGTPKTPPLHGRVVGITTTGYYVASSDSVGEVDIALARRGVLHRCAEWFPSAKVVRV